MTIISDCLTHCNVMLHCTHQWDMNSYIAFPFFAQITFLTTLNLESVSGRIFRSTLKNTLKSLQDLRYFLQRVCLKSNQYYLHKLINWSGECFVLDTSYGIKKTQVRNIEVSIICRLINQLNEFSAIWNYFHFCWRNMGFNIIWFSNNWLPCNERKFSLNYCQNLVDK